MIRRPTHEASALVLRLIDYGESDRIVTFFTDRLGKLKGIAKGARKSRRRFANALEFFVLTRVYFSRGTREGLFFIESCEAEDHYPEIRNNLRKTLCASHLIELLDHFTVEGKKNVRLFRLAVDFLKLIEEEDCEEESIRLFEYRLLRLSGFEPILNRCVTCGETLANIPAPLFSTREGGIRCGRCARTDLDAYPVSAGTLKTLITGSTIETGKVGRLAFSERTLRESELILGSFIRHITGRELKSLRIFHQVKMMDR
ncbi:MAG: DNA repair protein RecO [Deltaproteobacteria bacterium]|nr:DNA repair protein RecO [Deltaproteobacteria bacterium]